VAEQTPLREPDPAQRPARLAFYGGFILIALGGITAGLAVLLRVQADLRNDFLAVRDSIERLADATAGRSLVAGLGVDEKVFVTPDAGSFHKEGCTLVARAEHVRPARREEALEAGLAACRVCKP
jgi:hypothetical protein